jgi:hypothetical protein
VNLGVSGDVTIQMPTKMPLIEAQLLNEAQNWLILQKMPLI